MENQCLPKKVPGFCSFRYGLALLLHFCNSAIMAQRVCLNLTMVAMVNSTKPHSLLNESAVEMLDDVKGTVSTGQHEIWVKWAPPLERGRLTSMTLSGFVMGPFIVLLVSGFICDLLGWPMVFYIFGIVGCVLSLSWFILFYDDPKDHPYMSSSEKDYIISSLTQQVSSGRQSLPIKAMLMSLPLWAIILNSFAFIWSNSLLVTYTPTFISTVLHVNVRENGLLSSLPYLLAYICGIVAGQMSDFFLCRKIFSVVTVRKLFTTLGTLCPVIFTMCLLYLSFNFYSTVIFLTLANSTLSFSYCGQLINALDIAPRYYGFIKAVTALLGMFGGLISSTVAGLILNQGLAALAWLAWNSLCSPCWPLTCYLSAFLCLMNAEISGVCHHIQHHNGSEEENLECFFLIV
ncbi:sodium-dependent phosphate transport protein 1 isoform X5 [Meriones unguiculatus]|uniref:sodium-dependent phosphate transport protein 1 isoform X5 n=1 Tax=Meriones unguiculatus TaxID=10047 RepID=UPI00293EED79|nr:sodium-dependent phosphate transport protein 1 isoform X5 [Meriones unguiculatus]